MASTAEQNSTSTDKGPHPQSQSPFFSHLNLDVRNEIYKHMDIHCLRVSSVWSGFGLSSKLATSEIRGATEHKFAIWLKEWKEKEARKPGHSALKTMQYGIDYHFNPSRNAVIPELSVWLEYPMPDRRKPGINAQRQFVCTLTEHLRFEKMWLHFVPRVPDSESGSWWRAKDAWWKTYDWEGAGLYQWEHWITAEPETWDTTIRLVRCNRPKTRLREGFYYASFRPRPKMREEWRKERLNVFLVGESEGTVTCERVVGEGGGWMRVQRGVAE